MFKTISDHLWSILAVLFSGIGTAIFFKGQSGNKLKQKQSSGKNSTNIQAGGNINFGGKSDE